MHPILFDLNGFEIHSYGFLGAMGFLFVAFTALRRGKVIGIKSERMADLIFWSALISLVGSRLVFILQNPGVFSTWSEWVNLRTGGLVFYGAILFGVPAGSLMIRYFKMPFFATWDIFAAAFPIAHAASRVGCYLAGCCYGLQWDGPLAVVFNHPRAVAPQGVAMHPVQLYEAGALLVIGIIANVVFYKKKFHGQVMLVYLVLYAIARSVVEMFRGDASRGYFMESLLGSTLSYSQGFSILLAGFAIVVFGVIAKRSPANTIKGPIASE